MVNKIIKGCHCNSITDPEKKYLFVEEIVGDKALCSWISKKKKERVRDFFKITDLIWIPPKHGVINL